MLDLRWLDEHGDEPVIGLQKGYVGLIDANFWNISVQVSVPLGAAFREALWTPFRVRTGFSSISQGGAAAPLTLGYDM